MNISAKFAMISSAAFAAACFAVAIAGFLSLSDITDATQAADARGFAWFWTFLASIATLFGILSWRIDWTKHDDRNA